MPDLVDEIRELACVLAASDDEDVRDSAAIVCRQYRLQRLVAGGLSAVESMISDGPEVSDDDPRLVVALERFRDHLKALLRWARDSGRMS